jgi:hypothetical protein
MFEIEGAADEAVLDKDRSYMMCTCILEGNKVYSPVYQIHLWGCHTLLFVILPIEVKMITTRLVLIKRTWQRDGLFNFFFHTEIGFEEALFTNCDTFPFSASKLRVICIQKSTPRDK